MNVCPSCGHQCQQNTMTCPQCGRFYSKIIELIEQEFAAEQQNTWRSRLQRIQQAQSVSDGLHQEWSRIKASLSLQARLTLLFIFMFIFALLVTVL